jgi:hypothetical protein
MFALLWQSVAAAGQVWPAAQAQQLAHAALHWLERGHHHHDDGSYHEDDSSESVQHLMADGGTHVSLLLPGGWTTGPCMRSSAPVMTVVSIGPPPFIDGPHRPPRSST